MRACRILRRGNINLSEEFKQFWEQIHQNTFPLGFRFSDLFPSNSIRLHALPDSRLASLDIEYQIYLNRAKELGNEILGHASQCWIVVSHVKQDLNRFEDSHLLSLIKKFNLYDRLEFVDRFEAETDQILWVAHAAKMQWFSDGFDPELIDIADDVWPRPFWVSSSTGAIFAPYEGGFDIVVKDKVCLATLKSDYADWLPPKLYS